MFNAPRPGQRYAATNQGFAGSFVDENPLAGSAYDGLDPWSAAPTPSPPPIPSAPTVFGAVIGELNDRHITILIEDMFHPVDATVPAIYNTAFSAVDPTNSGETSVNSLSRVLGTSSLPAATIDRVRKSNHLFVR